MPKNTPKTEIPKSRKFFKRDELRNPPFSCFFSHSHHVQTSSKMMDFYGFLWIFTDFYGFSHGFPMDFPMDFPMVFPWFCTSMAPSGMVGFWPETQRGFLRIGTAELHGVGGAQASCFEVEKYGGFHQWLLIMVKNGLIIVANSI